MTELNGGDQFFNSKQEAPVRLTPQVLEQINNSQSEESKDASLNTSSLSGLRRTTGRSLNYVFKERFSFNLTSGFEEYSLKVYSLKPQP